MSNRQTASTPGVRHRQAARRTPRWIRLLLLLPFIAVFWCPGRDAVNPVILGVSCVYWYQALWIMIAAVLLYTVYRVEN